MILSINQTNGPREPWHIGINRNAHKWKALILAIPFSLFITAFLEMIQIVFFNFIEAPLETMGVLVQVVSAEARALWVPVMFQLLIAVVLWSDYLKKRIYLFLPITLLACAAVYANIYLELIDYSAFKGYPPALAAIVVCAALTYGWVWVLSPYFFKRRKSSPLVAVIAVGIPVASFFGAVGVSYCNYTLYIGDYTTLHLASLHLSYLFYHTSFSGILIACCNHSSRLSRKEWGPIIASVATFVLAEATRNLEAFQESLPVFLEHTHLGQAAIGDFRKDSSSQLSAAIDAALPESDDAELKRFERFSNLPDLGEFDLSRYNVLLINMEATRYDWSSFGDPKNDRTPNLKAFSKNRFWFSNAWGPANYTVQVFSSIFTMAYPSFTPIEIPRRVAYANLKSKAHTMAEIFKESMYNTFWVGHSMKIKGLNQGFDTIKRFKKDPDIKDAAIETINKYKDKDAPFFGWIFFKSPHSGYHVCYPDMPGETKEERYWQELRFGDEMIGSVLSHLEKSGLLEKTVVVFFADHGEEFKDHKKTGHIQLHAEVAHVPFVVHIPGVKGRRMDRLTSTFYLFPWLLRYGPPKMASNAERAIIRNIGPMLRETGGAVVSERLRRNKMMVTLTYPRYRLFHNLSSGLTKLFDIKKDPKEKKNIWKSDKKLRAGFEKRLNGYLAIREYRKAFKIVNRKY